MFDEDVADQRVPIHDQVTSKVESTANFLSNQLRDGKLQMVVNYLQDDDRVPDDIYDEVLLQIEDDLEDDPELYGTFIDKLIDDLKDDTAKDKSSDPGPVFDAKYIKKLKGNLTRWYNNSDITKFNAWKDKNLTDSTQIDDILGALSTDTNSEGLSYDYIFNRLVEGIGRPRERISSRRR